MAEYIEKQKVINWFSPYGHTEEPIPFETLVADLRGMKSEDVSPVVHGRWEKWNGDDRHHCTVCECYANAERDSYGYIAYEFLDNYCPNCGANMESEE